MCSVLAIAISCAYFPTIQDLMARGSEYNNQFSKLPLGRWVKIHEQMPTDRVYFKRQAHGGSAFDSRRDRLILFGSDTHGKDWKNSPIFFDVARRQWSRLHPDDDQSTYRVNAEGIPVAGPDGDHPWAMHTFGAVSYHAQYDQLVVSSHPKHMDPERFTTVLAKIWPQIAHHPTWLLDLSSEKWAPLRSDSVSFFPYATAYDSERGVIIGYKTSGIYELSGDPAEWTRVVEGGLLGYHNNAVYDSWHKALVVFGSHDKSNDVVIYKPATSHHQIMPTPGIRPPKDSSTPMAFHAGIGRTVVLIDRPQRNVDATREIDGYTETWLYDLEKDSWTNIETVTLPFVSGMNYNMEYDPIRDVLLLVASAQGKATAVWVLHL